MRRGQNPAKNIHEVAQPKDLSIVVVNFIPVLAGYHAQSLEVLKACLASIRAATPPPFDLMVFDNHSCPEVRRYLFDELTADRIQYLVLSDTNIGKIGAWNYMFGAAQGRYIAYADADIFFRPGWLEDALALFETFPNVGMVTSCPVRNPPEVLTASQEWGRRQHVLREGVFIEWEDYLEHALSLGWDEAKACQMYQAGTDYLLEYGGHKALIGAGHFQFIAPREVLRSILPLPSGAPMRGERILDQAINDRGYLRLTGTKAYVRHMGNQVETAPAAPSPRLGVLRRLLWLPGIRHVLLWLYQRLFDLFFHNVE
jgi:glycosyltransferase involved in cell wall biosynthesis